MLYDDYRSVSFEGGSGGGNGERSKACDEWSASATSCEERVSKQEGGTAASAVEKSHRWT